MEDLISFEDDKCLKPSVGLNQADQGMSAGTSDPTYGGTELTEVNMHSGVDDNMLNMSAHASKYNEFLATKQEEIRIQKERLKLKDKQLELELELAQSRRKILEMELGLHSPINQSSLPSFQELPEQDFQVINSPHVPSTPQCTPKPGLVQLGSIVPNQSGGVLLSKSSTDANNLYTKKAFNNVPESFPIRSRHASNETPTSSNSNAKQVPKIVSSPHSKELLHDKADTNTKLLEDAFQCIASNIQQGPLPPRNVQKFSGDPIDFHRFLTDFEENIASRTADPMTRLTYLIGHCIGQAHETIQSCIIIRPAERAYRTAMNLLTEQFGQEYKVVDAHMKLLKNGPRLKQDDPDALYKLSTQMRNCHITLTEWGFYANLNNHDTLNNR